MSIEIAPPAVPPAEPLDPQIQLLIDNLPGGIALPAGNDLVKSRQQFRRLTVALRDQQPPADLASAEDIEVAGASGPLNARIYRPHNPIADATLIFIHGGGFIVGDVESYDLHARCMAERTNLVTVSVEYRLAPEDAFPAAADDAIALTKAIIADAGRFGGSRVIVSGDSAGGGLAAVAARRVQGLVGQVMMYPVTDFTQDFPSIGQHADGPVLTKATGEVFLDAYVAGADRSDPDLSPLVADPLVPAALDALPPAVVVTTEYDILRDAGIAYADRLSGAGVPLTHLHYPSLMHGFMGFYPLSEACDKAFTEVCAATVGLLE